MDEHSGCFQLLATVNSAAVNTEVPYPFQLWFSPDRRPGVGLLDRIVVVESPSRVRLFANPWTAARQASLTLTISQSLPKFMFI